MNTDALTDLIHKAITDYENDSGDQFEGDVYDLAENIAIIIQRAQEA